MFPFEVKHPAETPYISQVRIKSWREWKCIQSPVEASMMKNFEKIIRWMILLSDFKI